MSEIIDLVKQSLGEDVMIVLNVYRSVLKRTKTYTALE